jgi:ankyrin repeat protein
MADPTVESGPAPLFGAAWQGHAAVATLLLGAGADRTKRTPWGTAGDVALKHGHAKVARLLTARRVLNFD